MSTRARISLYVSIVVALTLACLYGAWAAATPFPGYWGLGVFAFIACLPEITSTRLRGGDAEGSISFVIHLAAGLLFGGAWGAVVVLISTGIGQLVRRNPPIKLVFNTAQRTLALIVALFVYDLCGGVAGAAFMQPGSGAGETNGVPVFEQAIRSILAFSAASVVYFVLNSIAVSGAVAISSGRSFVQVWRRNTLWVFGYDITASLLFALPLCFFYLQWNQDPSGLDRFKFLIAILGIFGIRHLYSQKNALQLAYDRLDDAHERLEQNVREQLVMMVKSIEARDPYTSGHSRRVGALAKAIAVEYGLPSEEVEKVENAAILHDVGKIHAEFAPLLAKDGRLTPEEWEIMKTHSVKSAELVGLFASFRGDVELMVRHHHERWDGKGYPDGVTAAAIPFGARIIMISDTIDAMTTDRPYRKALGFETVVEELQKYRGIQFDPDLVDATIRSMTIRRMVSEPSFLAEQAVVTTSRAIHAKVPLRSQNSFWEGIKGMSGGASPSGQS